MAVVQILATSIDLLDKDIAALLGHGQTNVAAAAGGNNGADVLLNRYACLGAIGPDILYFLLDGSPNALAVQDFIIRLYSTFAALDAVGEELNKLKNAATDAVESIPCVGTAIAVGVDTVDKVKEEAISVVQILKKLAEGLFVETSGLNLFSLLESPRQMGKDPSQWYWADHLHYHRSGEFTRNLLDLALLDPKYRDKPALGAYAAGYFTHYVADTIGHPYVNAIVGGPYRLHRQRHTLVENFIDAVVWRNGFVAGPVGGQDNNPLTGEPWFDRPRTATTPKDATPASFYRSRVHNLFEVDGASASLSDTISTFLDGVAGTLGDVNKTFGIDSIEFVPDGLFDQWCQLFVDAMHKTYEGTDHPTLVNPQLNGFLSKKDIATAYVACFGLMRMVTTEPVDDPTPPDWTEISDALKKAWNDLKTKAGDALSKIFSAPDFGSGGSFSFSAAWKALRKWVGQVLDGVVELIEAAGSLLLDLCDAGLTVVKEVVQLVLYLIQKGLFEAYAAVRRMLELRAYAQPTDETASALPQLWQATAPATGGSPIAAFGRSRAYPVMERVEDPGIIPPILGFGTTKYSQDQLFCEIEPMQHPLADNPTGIELPAIDKVMVHTNKTANPLWELFWAKPATDMFSAASQSPAVPQTPTGHPFDPIPGLDFGGIVPNCATGLRTILANAKKAGATSVVAGDFILPNYNLDGDRGAAFPDWRLTAGSLRPPSGTKTVFDIGPWEKK